MSKEITKLGEKEILELYRAGSLTEHIFSHVSYSDKKNSVFEIYVELHNRGEIDFLSLTASDAFDALTASLFFSGQYVFTEVIPQLQSSTLDMMLAIDRLVKKGGHDLAANQPNAAFRQWCKADLKRANEVIELALKDEPLAKSYLTFALEAGNMIDEAIKVFEGSSGERQLAAATALGRMAYDNVDLANAVISSFAKALKNGADDVLLANILMASVSVASKSGALVSDDIRSIVAHVISSLSGPTHSAIANVLFQHGSIFPRDLVRQLLSGLAALDATHSGTIETIDVALTGLLRTSSGDDAINFVAEILSKSHEKLSLRQFSSFSHQLVRDARLESVFVEWMVSGNHALCDGLSKLFGDQSLSEKPLNLSADKLSPYECEFLCRKSIGYLFIHPVLPASVIVSVLRVCGDEVAGTIADLLVECLLRNYGGKIKDYLNSIREDDRAFARVRAALARDAEYFKEVQSVGELKELHPSEVNRQAQRTRMSDEMRSAHKEAIKNSIFINLVTRSVILYGKRTLSYIGDSKGERKPFEMDLHSHGFSYEIPKLEIIDPVELGYMLFAFRAERPKA